MSATTCSSVKPVVCDLLRRQRLGDHADDPAAALEDRVGDDPHQPDPAAAVDQSEPMARQERVPRWPGGLGVLRIDPRPRSRSRCRCSFMSRPLLCSRLMVITLWPERARSSSEAGSPVEIAG